MAAVKIIFDRPDLSWPPFFFFFFFSVCLSISLTSISPLSHNPLCHSLKDSESLQHAGLGHCGPDKKLLCETSPSLTQQNITYIFWDHTSYDSLCPWVPVFDLF